MSLTDLKWAPTATGLAGTWGTIANAAGKGANTHATWTSSTSAGTATLEASGFAAQAALPGSTGLTIAAVRVTIRYATSSTTLVSALTCRLFNGTTALGAGTTAMTRTANSVVETTYTITGITYAHLADLRVRIVATRSASTTQSIVYVDRVGIEIDYTWTGWTAASAGLNNVHADDQANPPLTSFNSGVAYCMGTQFVVAGTGKYLLGIRFWRPADAAMVSSTIEGALFRVIDSQEVAGSRLAFGDITGEVAGGWVPRYLPTPPPLLPGEQYVATVRFPIYYPFVNAAWTDLTAGSVRAPAGPNARYVQADAGMAFPSLLGSDQHYYIDPIVGDLPALEPGRPLLAAA